MKTRAYECCILGAGPAGLGAALELVNRGVRDIIIIDRNSIVGGLARTETFDGSRFDLGPHRFFTKNREINALWHSTLGEDFKPIRRLTRIYYKNKYFNYPIKVLDALTKLGLRESLQALISFAAAKVHSDGDADNFETWMIKKFGRKLYEVFFKTYTEKVWGIPCNEISAEWAAQRIKGLDIIQVIKSAFRSPSRTPKTLVEEFDYPVLGAGQMYEAMADTITARGATVLLNARAIRFQASGNHLQSVVVIDGGEEYTIQARQFFSSIPITYFFKMLNPPEPETILKAADSLYFRGHITVNLLVDGDDLFPDQWIYIHSPEIQMARLANYNNFSRQMVGRKGLSALSVEYFVFQHEDLWRLRDEDILAQAIEELQHVKLVPRERVEQGWTVRETECYPTYYLGFQEPYQTLVKRIDEFENMYPIGRGGMYKYNNQDHSLLSGLLAARNYLQLPGSPFSLWNINIDAEYHESAERGS